MLERWDDHESRHAVHPNENPIDAVVFLVPGTVGTKAAFDFTIVGFAPGHQQSGRARRGTAACGTSSGTLGSATASQTRFVPASGRDRGGLQEYIVQNNNWGNPTGSTQVINYTGNRLHRREQQRLRKQRAGILPVYLRRRERQRRQRYLQHLVRHAACRSRSARSKAR